MHQCKLLSTLTSTWPAGLPRLLVDVRHEASHNDMPSLSLLRLAAAQALDWLQAAYWQRQEAHLLQQQQSVVHILRASRLSTNFSLGMGFQCHGGIHPAVMGPFT